jgi:long-subunit acyl-CoA synthetase (AMP-forming)
LKSLTEHLKQEARTGSSVGRTLLQDNNGSLSLADVLERCDNLSNLLIREKFQFVALYGDNSCDWVTVDLACQQAAICLIPIPTFFSQKQISHVFNTVAIDLVIGDSVEAFIAASGLPIDSASAIQYGQMQLMKIGVPKNGLSLPEGTHKITFTSGSTGQPKGVCLSSEQQLTQACALASTVALQQPKHLCLLPLSTLLENIAGIYAPLIAGGQVIIPPLSELGFDGSSNLDPKLFCAAISRYQPNSIILTPQLLVLLITAVSQGWTPPVSLKFVAVGGGRVSAQLMAQAHQCNIPAYEGYGLSECASVVSLNIPNNNGVNTSGKPLPHLQVQIENSEIVIKGNAMLGYAGQPDSWYQESIYSGDLGSLDNAGYLIVSGRRKNLLISSFGRNINPEWVESQLLSNIAITDAVVFGDDRPYCVALLYLRDSKLTDAAIQAFMDGVNDSLPDYARIIRWTRLPAGLNTQLGLLTENGRPIRPAILTAHESLLSTLYNNPTQHLTATANL